MHLVKIKEDYFHVEDISTQLSLGSHGSISLTINTLKHPDYYKFFTEVFDSYSQDSFTQYVKELKFNIQYKNLRGNGCLIKSLDIDSMNYLLYVNINCDYLEQVTVQEKRDELIDDVLNEKTSNNKII
jgi:hypothetical protein